MIWQSEEEGYGPIPEEYQGWTYEQFTQERPDPADYMPIWTPEEATHYMMYEITTEGTPTSPAFANPEELAQWLTDTGATVWAKMTLTYEEWLNLITG